MATLATGSFSLPKHMVPGVWQKAPGQSVLARLSAAEPQEFGEHQYMTLTAPPRGEVVGEGVEKSESTATFAPVTAIPRKVQVTQRFNQEVMWADESRQLGVLQTMRDLTGVALGRALDLIGYEYELDRPRAAAFVRGYQSLLPLPELQSVRPLYRYLYRLLEVQGSVDLNIWLGWPAHFDRQI